MHRNFSLNDDFNCCMASLNYSGLMLASQGELQDIDKYEDDDDEDMNLNGDQNAEKIDKKMSYVYFKPLNEHKNLKDWHYKLNLNERVECMAQGSGWCAVATNTGFIRIFSTEGVQKMILHQTSQIVTMAGYENQLAIFYHSGLPVYES